jgi:tyrosine-specific transport protein
MLLKKRMNKKLAAISTLIGTVIGAGILGIPYVVARSGFLIGTIHVILIGIITILTNLYMGEIVLRTKGTHQLTGYAKKYLGEKGKVIMFIAMAFGIFAALLAYLIGEGNSLSYIFFGTTSFSTYFAFAFWAILSGMIYFGIRSLERGEVIGVSIITILILSMLAFFWNDINPANLSYINYENLFVPFGVILFAYLGFASIPEISRILKNQKEKIKGTIIFGYLFCLAIYIIFPLIVVGLKGMSTPEIATLALGRVFILFGILTLFSSYLSLSIALQDTLKFDFNIKRINAWLITISIPLLLFILLEIFNFVHFTKVLGIGGVISGGLTALLILLMTSRAKKFGERIPEFSVPYSKILTGTLIIIFVIGAIIEIISF